MEVIGELSLAIMQGLSLLCQQGIDFLNLPSNVLFAGL
jgi:hypothetical protein